MLCLKGALQKKIGFRPFRFDNWQQFVQSADMFGTFLSQTISAMHLAKNNQQLWSNPLVR